MSVRFWKYDGAGNDFVLVEKKALLKGTAKSVARALCDRRHGVGADGLLVVDKKKKTVDYYNADGSEAFCGNGSRCAAMWLYDQKGGAGREVSFRSAAGATEARILGPSLAAVRMPEPKFIREVALSTAARRWRAWLWDTGVPHAVVEVASLRDLDVQKDGATLRFHKEFAPKGANVDFISVIGRRAVAMRTYERGVEGETLACGTGAVAAALTAELLGGSLPMTVKPLRGEPLTVSRGQDGVYLSGPARAVFSGEIP